MDWTLNPKKIQSPKKDQSKKVLTQASRQILHFALENANNELKCKTLQEFTQILLKQVQNWWIQNADLDKAEKRPFHRIYSLECKRSKSPKRFQKRKPYENAAKINIQKPQPQNQSPFFNKQPNSQSPKNPSSQTSPFAPERLVQTKYVLGQEIIQQKDKMRIIQHEQSILNLVVEEDKSRKPIQKKKKVKGIDIVGIHPDEQNDQIQYEP